MSGPPSEPALPCPGSEPGDVRLLLAGLVLGTLFGGLLVGVIWLAVGGPAPSIAERSPSETALSEERDRLRKQLDEMPPRVPPENDKLKAREEELQKQLRDKETAWDQERAWMAKELTGLKEKNNQLEQRLKQPEKKPSNAQPQATAPTPAPAKPPSPPADEVEIMGPVVSTDTGSIQLARIGAGEYVTPAGIPHPASTGTKDAPYIVSLNKVPLVRVDKDGVARNRMDEIEPFPHIWCGLIAIRSKTNPLQKPRYHRAYHPPRVVLPPKVGSGRWEFALGIEVKSDAIADLRHYVEHGGELALGRRAVVAIDDGPVHELSMPPDAAGNAPPTRLEDAKVKIAMELKNGVLVVTAPAASKSLCTIAELEVVRPVRDIPELKARGVTLFTVRKK